jgi:hypothetical protein
VRPARHRTPLRHACQSAKTWGMMRVAEAQQQHLFAVLFEIELTTPRAHTTRTDKTLAHKTLAHKTLAHKTLAHKTLAHKTLGNGTLRNSTLTNSAGRVGACLHGLLRSACGRARIQPLKQSGGNTRHPQVSDEIAGAHAPLASTQRIRLVAVSSLPTAVPVMSWHVRMTASSAADGGRARVNWTVTRRARFVLQHPGSWLAYHQHRQAQVFRPKQWGSKRPISQLLPRLGALAPCSSGSDASGPRRVSMASGTTVTEPSALTNGLPVPVIPWAVLSARMTAGE